MLSSSFKAKRSRFQAGQSLFQAGRAVSILGRLVSISSSLENNESGAKHSAKANSCLRPQSKVKAMPREAISEKKTFKADRHFKWCFVRSPKVQIF